jgi:hypothetical protein
MSRNCLIVLLVLSVCALTHANVTPVPEFTGNLWEGFETIGPIGGYPGPINIYGGQGTFDDTIAHFIQIAVSLYSFPNDTYIFPYDGNIMGGAVTGWATFGFSAPVTDFGSYIGTADVISGGSVIFKDELGQTIYSEPLTINLGEWAWHGWHSDVPFSSVEIRGAAQIGAGPTVFDDVTAITVPEPTTLALAAVGLALSLRRR